MNVLYGLWALVSGGYFDGRPRTDAGLFRPGRIDVTPTHMRARRGHYRPRAHRAGVRIAIALGVLVLFVAWLTNPSAAHALQADAFWLAVGLVGYWVVYKLRKWEVHREIRDPLGVWLAGHLGDARYLTQPDRMIRISVDVLSRPTRIYLPETYAPGAQAAEDRFVKACAAKIRLPSPTPTWELGGTEPYLELVPAPEPPSLVSYSDEKVRELYEKSSATEPFLGLGPREAPYYLNYLTSAPHTGVSATTNAGKSSSRRPTVAKAIHDGWLVLVLDPKQDSQTWAESLSAVHYAVKPREIYDALRWLSAEVDRRFAIFREHKDIDGNIDPALVGPPILVIAEELNSMELDLRHWWKEVRQQGDSMQCTAMHALQRSLNMGRGVGIYVNVIAQTLTCQAIGGPAALENIPLRMLIWPTHATWNRLAPQLRVAGKYPRTQKCQGRVHVVMGDESTPVQTMWMTSREAYDYAAAGEMATFPPVYEKLRAVPELAEEGGSTTSVSAGIGTAGGTLLMAPSTPEVVDAEVVETITLTQAAEKFGISRKTLENHATRRTPGFPRPVQDPQPGRAGIYDAVEMERWIEGNPRRGGVA